MIFGTDLGSLTESMYLGIPFTDNFRSYSIIVNPQSTTYIIDKTVVINRIGYPRKNIEELIRNKNRVISRIYFEDYPDIIFDPYLPRLNMKIMWNGEILETLGEENIDPSDKTQSIYYSSDSDILYFPRAKNFRDKPGIKGEYNYVGYLLYQTGVNLYDTCFTDLDIVKCGKGIW